MKEEFNKKIIPRTDDFSWVYQVDEVYTQDNNIVVEGFAFEIGVDARKGNFAIAFRNTETDEVLSLQTEYIRRNDVNAYFMCENDYSESGFRASINKESLFPEESEYEILVHLKNSRSAYCTGIYLSDGELSYVKEGEKLPYDVEDNELQQVVGEGKIRLFLPELGVYAYQYDGSIYFLMEDKYKQQDEYLNRIVMTLWTIQIDRLPQNRLELETTAEEINTYYDDEIQCGQYYVCKVDLPTAYSITKMDVGNYNNGHYVWRKIIRPYYEFEKQKGNNE